MKETGDHPDVVSYARGDYSGFSGQELADVLKHLQVCGECRDLVLFVRKTSAMLRQEGRIERVAKALGMTREDIEMEMKRDTSIAALINRPPEPPVSSPAPSEKPLSPVRK